MRRGTVIRSWLAAGIALAGMVATAAPAGAASVTGAGSVSCSYGTTISFNPPLIPGKGTAVGKGVMELITLAPTTIGSCTGTVTAGSLPVAGTLTKPMVVKAKPNTFNKVNYAGGCLFFSSYALVIKHATIAWTVATGKMRPTKLALAPGGLTSNGLGNLGYALAGTASGSFAGPGSLHLFFDATSTSALQGCLGGSGTVPSLTVDPAQSSVNMG